MPLSFTVKQHFQTMEAALKDVADINSACIRVSILAVATYMLLVIITFTVFRHDLAYLQPEERAAAALAATALTTSLVLRIIMHASQALCPDADTARQRRTSGVFWLSHCANGVAAVTSWTFALAPVPTLIDVVTGCRVHMLRWCEWTVLAFVMTFMTDVADKNKAWSAVALAASQSASTFCGYLLPLCAGPMSWGVVVTISFGFFAALVPKWLQRRRLCREARACAAALRDSAAHADAAALAARIGISFYLLSACCVAWTGFVCVFFMHATVRFSGFDTREAPTWPFILDAVIDVAAKLVYAAIIVDMHGALYDGAMQRSERRLKELQSIIAVVWSASSDALAVSVRHDGGGRGGYVETAVSPTADALLAHAAMESRGKAPAPLGWDAPWPDDDAAETVYGLAGGAGEPADILAVRFTYRDGQPAGQLLEGGENAPSAAEASGFAELIRKAWLLEPTPEGALRLTHDLFRADGTKMHVEAKVTRIGSWRLVVVVRDITQRLLVFEAEKALVKQATAHERDSAANRFTRHEVKNGLLSAIGLVDALQELSAPGTAREADRAPDAIGATARVSADDALGSLARCVGELQTTLTETLNSVLSETMARELVYDSYDPVPELVDVVALLKGHATGIGGAKGSRFKIETWPAEIPFLVLDPQLLHCIYRNAISNASKYGDPFGEVVTRLRLLRPDGTNASCAELHGAAAVGSAFTLTLEVFNEPGPDHSRLLDASGDALHDRVFAQGQRLHPDLRCANAGASTVSSGDGGWIMRKCAKALGGDCKIEFNLDGTVLTMTCPTTVASVAAEEDRRLWTPTCDAGDVVTAAAAVVVAAGNFTLPAFALPPHTWGIAIDDSNMQRKLLTRLLEFAGVEPHHIRVTGETPAEIYGFTATVAQHVRDHADDYHLVIVDENLDVLLPHGRTTVLGSECIVRLRNILDAEGLGSKLLTIVRSANDSAEDVATYRRRAHGFLPKAPVKREKVLDVLLPIWTQRFPGCVGDSPALQARKLLALSELIKRSVASHERLSAVVDASRLDRLFAVVAGSDRALAAIDETTPASPTLFADTLFADGSALRPDSFRTACSADLAPRPKAFMAARAQFHAEFASLEFSKNLRKRPPPWPPCRPGSPPSEKKYSRTS